MEDCLGYSVDDVAVRGWTYQPRNADAFPAGHQQFSQCEGYDQSALELAVARISGGKGHRRRTIGPHPHGVRGLPLVLADGEMIIARGATPVDVLRRLARDETAVLPETFTRTGAAAAVQAVNHIGGDATGFQHETRQRRRQRAAFTIGTSDCFDFLPDVPGCCDHQP